MQSKILQSIFRRLTISKCNKSINFSCQRTQRWLSTSINGKPVFKELQDVDSFLPILKSRIPKSANMYNIALLKKSKFAHDIQIYTMDELSEESIFFAFYDREDNLGQEISISSPSTQYFTKEVLEAFVHYAPIEWDKPYSFSSIDRDYSELFYKMSIKDKGNPTKILPCFFQYKSIEDSLHTEIKNKPEVTLGPLNLDKGIRFLLNEDNYSWENSRNHLTKIIERNINVNVGVYHNKGGELISCATFGGSGLGFCSQLITLSDYRRKGYGKMTTDTLYKKAAQNGFFPCGVVEVNNEGALTLGKKRHTTISHCVDFIYFDGYNF